MNIYHNFHSKNYDLRPEAPKPIKYVVIHHTEISFEETVKKLCDPEAKVSCHYIIDEDGSIYQLVGDFYRAWHAGPSKWKSDEKLNDISIGIEIVNSGRTEFTSEQMNSLVQLCRLLKDKYILHRNNFIGHSDVAPNRKIDPGPFFNWHKLSQEGIGIKFKNIANTEIVNLTQQNTKATQKKLKLLGYNINITGIPDKDTHNVIRAFQLHFHHSSIFAQGNIEDLFNREKNYLWDKGSNSILDLLTQDF